MSRQRNILALTVSLALLLGPARLVAADDWADARKAFRSAQNRESHRDRIEAYTEIAFFDGADAVEEVLRAMVAEKNPAVVVAALKTLGAFETDGAKQKLLEELRGAKGKRRTFSLLAIGEQPGSESATTLIAIVEGKDMMLAAQAALALGKKQVPGAMPYFTGMLQHKEWQVRAAGARAIILLAGPVPTPPKDPKETERPWLPEWFKKDDVLWPLIDALEASDGADRRFLIEALERVTNQDFGYDVSAWAQFVDGTDPGSIKRKPKKTPYFFGVPVYGKRVVIVLCNNLRGDAPHPYERDRLKELCTVPGGRPVPWYEIRTVKAFMAAWVARTINDMPTKGHKFDLFTTGNKALPVFGKLKPVNNGTKKTVITEVEELKVEAGNDTYEGLMRALDISGRKDGVAWDKGPDEILHVSCAVPWLSEVTELPVVAAAVGMKARLRMVPIHTVGVKEHPGQMMKAISEQSGGTYVDLER